MLSQDEIHEIKKRSANCDGVADASVKHLLSHISELEAQNKEMEELLHRAKSVIPSEYEDEIEVRTEINRFFNRK